MATRATYRFVGASRFVPNTTLYIHHDGYLEGAANKFLETIQLSDGRMGAEAVIRSQPAEITREHEAHGDTDFRYDLQQQDGIWWVKAYERVRSWDGDKYRENYKCVANEPMAAFITKYAGVEVRVDPYGGLRTRDMAVKWLEDRTVYAQEYAQQHPQFTGNIASLKNEVRQRQDFLVTFAAAEVAA